MKKSRTDWNRLDALRDREIDFSDIPDLSPKMFARPIVRHGLKPVPPKNQMAIRVGVAHTGHSAPCMRCPYRKQGRGYQTRINALLRAYVEERKIA